MGVLVAQYHPIGRQTVGFDGLREGGKWKEGEEEKSKGGINVERRQERERGGRENEERQIERARRDKKGERGSGKKK